MAQYKLTNSEGLSITVSSDKPPTEEDAIAVFNNVQSQGLLALSLGDRQTKEVKGRRRGSEPRKVEESYASFVDREMPKALGIPSEKWDSQKGASIPVRTALGFLANEADKLQYLTSTYGADNVRAINIGGNNNFIFRDSKDNKWRSVDGQSRLELADFTADLASEILPTVASVVGGLAGLVSGSPTGPGAVATSAGLSAVAYGTVGTAQDIAARKVLGFDAEVKETALRRGKEAAIGGAIDIATMKLGKPLLSFVGRKARGLRSPAMDEIDAIYRQGIDMPAVFRESEASLIRAQEIANRYPDSATARFFEDVRTKAGMVMEERIGYSFQTAQQSEDILRSAFDTISKQFNDDISKIVNALESTRVSIAETKPLTIIPPKSDFTKLANQEYNKRIANQLQGLNIDNLVSPERLGRKVQETLASVFAANKRQKDLLYGRANELLKDSSVSAAEIGEIFNAFPNTAILDANNLVAGVLNPNMLKSAEKATETLFDIGDELVSFGQLNQAIQVLEQATSRNGSLAVSPNAGVARQITEKLRALRSKVLESAPQPAREAFEKAQNFYKNEYLPADEVFGKIVKPRIGQNVDQVIRGDIGIDQLDFVFNSSEVMGNIAKNSSRIKEILRYSGNNPEIRNSMRTAWMQSKGLVAGEPIPNINLSPADYDIIEALWNKDKVSVFKNLQKTVNGKDEFTATFSGQLQDIAKANSKAADEKLIKLAEQEATQKKQFDDLVSTKFIKMMNQGRIPLPDNGVTMGTMAEGLMKAKPVDLNNFIQTLEKSGSVSLRGHFENSVIYDLIRVSGAKTDKAQMGRMGYQLWNPELMSKKLSNADYRTNLNQIFGKDRVNAIETWNNAIKRFSVERPAKDYGIKSGSTANEKGVQFFFSNVGNTVKNRVTSAMLTFAIQSDAFLAKAAPALRKDVLTAEVYDDMLITLQKGLFTSSKGLQILRDHSEADPVFRDWVTSQYADVFASEPQE